jgi:hypothetical protein
MMLVLVVDPHLLPLPMEKSQTNEVSYTCMIADAVLVLDSRPIVGQIFR